MLMPMILCYYGLPPPSMPNDQNNCKDGSNAKNPCSPPSSKETRPE